MNAKNPLLGILGGLGPMSTFYFCELLTAHTLAKKDSDHIDLIVSSRATTPDRTAYILGKSKENPLPVMEEEARRLVAAGAELLTIPCNTAHYFYDHLQKKCPIPILNIIDETVFHLKRIGCTRFGLLATEGTVYAGAYQAIAERMGLTCIVPDESGQAALSSVIFDLIKQNKDAEPSEIQNISEPLIKQGCEKLVLGCTELSLLKKQGLNDPFFLDSLEVLAYQTILHCGKTPVDFSPSFFEGRLQP